jgi:arylsulfatase A-like enzyme
MRILFRLFLLCCCFVVQSTAKPVAEQRPNVIIILSDDQGYGDVGAHGNPVLKTPHLDKLHSTSVRLTDFHVSPMCTPTRGQLLTGLDALRNGATSVTAGRSLLRPGIPTMAEAFKASGYRTAMFGKWHLGDSWPNLPHQRGFEEAVYHLGWGVLSIAATWGNDNFDDRYFHNGVLKQYQGYCTDVWFDLAMQWIKGRKRTEPFFLYLPTNAPHGPLWVADKYKEPYKGKGPDAFFGMLANLDENMGRLDAFLRQQGLHENTLLIFMNDNGGTAGVRVFNAGMRAQKQQYYDGGHRAISFWRWPSGGLRAPGDIDALTQVQDVLPTLIELCSLQPGKTIKQKLDGVSLVPLLRKEADGRAESFNQRTLVVQYGQTPTKYDAAVMWQKWRLVKGTELYNLTDDPGQTRDVAAQHPAIVAQLRAHYDKWWAGVAPRLPEFVPIVLGAPQENPVTLTAVDWADVYCDNQNNCLRPGQNQNGVWHVRVARTSTYEFALRRWPREADAAITAGLPAFPAPGGVGNLPAGVALPIAQARLRVGAQEQRAPVTAQDKEIVFTVPLKAGDHTQVQTWFADAQGQQLCGAYYLYVKRK